MLKEKDDCSKTPFMYAAASGEVALVEWLLQIDKTMLNKHDKDRHNALFFAIQGGFFNMSLYLF